MFFNFKDLFNNVSDQVIWLLALVAIVLAVCAYATQGFGRAFFGILGVFIIIVAILLLKNAKEIAEWIKNVIFVPTEGGGIEEKVQAFIQLKNMPLF
ncbi:hypothetical protein EGW69_12020 [Enterococcus faecium]|uniref:hypothetical protein n=1 Tax=Enterococcus faecium TaxID=1352 RepID=UPI000F4DA539|nr:hypothetical protein [Enterococcus faecium]ROX59688.1 hypothetical protein EGW10_11965 [Enterococcus faecium]ROX60709.1 hypothetical protein EGW32_11960 [Enterococcus faecium]ROY20833.1 hypothetical protein EGW60_11340 [Enterococcus faecium]ROY54815.1 hypothetical protein EGW64_11345 [Enterococcus faecium]ROY71633.1 hypothetical protein EGW87_12015 [Enterococcus faecium]